jgi:3-hydroxybutyryl-CoA dehydrogenase
MGQDLVFKRIERSVVLSCIEDREAKQGLLGQRDASIPRETVFATDTTGLSISSLVSNPSRPERYSGLHFFNAAPRMNPVKVVRLTATIQGAIGLAIDLEKSLGEFPIVV